VLVSEVFWVVDFVVTLKSFDEFENDVPGILWVVFEIFSSAFFGKVELPSTFSSSLFSLEVTSGRFENFFCFCCSCFGIVLVGSVSFFD